jgi:hypothetical protein
MLRHNPEDSHLNILRGEKFMSYIIRPYLYGIVFSHQNCAVVREPWNKQTKWLACVEICVLHTNEGNRLVVRGIDNAH